MPASRRHHRAIAVLAHCLGALAALPALAPQPGAPPPTTPPAPAQSPATTPTRAAVAPTPAGVTPTPAAVAPVLGAGHALPVAAATVGPSVTSTTMPSAPPAVPTPDRAPLRASTPTVTVAVTSAGTPAPGYRIQVRNAGDRAVDTTVRQELPAGASLSNVTGGGRSSHAAGRPDEVTWQLKLPPKGTTTLQTTLHTDNPNRPLAAPACAYRDDGRRPYDCSTAIWSNVAQTADEPAGGGWLRLPILLGVLALLLVLGGFGLWWWQRRRRTRAYAAASAGPPTDPQRPASVGGAPEYAALGRRSGAPGTVYPKPGAPRAPQRRRTPPVWLLVGAAVLVLVGVVGVAGWTGTRQVTAMNAGQQPTSGAWVGRGVSGPVGVPLRETAFEFTVYRVDCGAADTDGRRCDATVGVRNVTPDQQAWHGQLQRAYLPAGRWVGVDESATRAMNQGRDVFADPVAAGTRLVLPLVFTVADGETPEQLELRSGVFSAGVRVDVP
ncbi:hypothetical protein ABT336_09275 [Micromonospora sp. NPDC000207]|uniref:hypothetical protein n=1 Tax=Micromonospora sp. NPDC000207 TaxID=3154246 RepID=UPI0033344E9D